MASTANAPRARQLGAELRDLRKRARMSMVEVASQLGRTHSHISRWENGNLTPSEADTAAVLAVLGITGEERDRLLDLARDAADPNWVAPGTDRQLSALMAYERTARTIIDVEPLIVPGLMQTAEYARATMIAFGATRGEAEHRAMVRLGRQHVLTDRSPVEMITVIGEHALRYPPCEPVVMTEQLHQLLTLGKRDNVSMHVLPMTRPSAPALSGPWVVIEDARTKPVLHLEHYSSSATLTDAKTVARYREAADTLRKVAMSPDESAEFIADVINEQETTQP